MKGSKGQSTYSIAKELGLTVNTVSTWRRRWTAGQGELEMFEKGVSNEGTGDRELLGKMLGLLEDRPRPGAPPRFTMSEYKQIVAMACRRPSEYGIPMNKWTHEMLARTAAAEKVVESISPRNVGKVLKKSGPAPA